MTTIGKKALVALSRNKIDVELHKIKGWFGTQNMTNYVSYGNLRYACINSLILAHAHNKEKVVCFTYDFESVFDQLDIEELNSKLEMLAIEQDLYSIYIERTYLCCGLLSLDQLHIEITNDSNEKK